MCTPFSKNISFSSLISFRSYDSNARCEGKRGKYIAFLQHASRSFDDGAFGYGSGAGADAMVVVEHYFRFALREGPFPYYVHLVAVGVWGAVGGDGEDLAGLAADEDVVFSFELADWVAPDECDGRWGWWLRGEELERGEGLVAAGEQGWW